MLTNGYMNGVDKSEKNDKMVNNNVHHDHPVSINANCYDDVVTLTNFIRTRTSYHPTVGIICGSGWGNIVHQLKNPDIIQYRDIPSFPVSTVIGHKGNFVIGSLQGKHVICMQGRIHPYEGYEIQQCTLPIRLMRLLGVDTLILTNAAGGLNQNYKPGDIVLINDQLFLPGLAGCSPLNGHNDERFGPRFVTMNNAYDKGLRKLAMDTAIMNGLRAHEGVYVMTGGPQFESPAENRYLRLIGADVVGMSTAHEAIVARHCGMKVLCISLVTNLSEMKSDSDTVEEDVHQEVLKTAEAFVEKAAGFVFEIVSQL